MGRWRTDVENWLAAEARGGDDAADAAFERVLMALPAVEPSPAFVARTAEAAWAARTRRRWTRGLAVAAAALLVAGVSGAALYMTLAGGGAWLLTTAAAAASGTLLSLVTSAATLAGWSAAAVDAAAIVAAAVATPYSVAAVIAIELVAAAVLLMLHRLLRSDIELRSPQAYCF